MPSSPPVTYRIDAQDRITSVNPAWDDFARANDGDHLVADRVLGRPLFEFISDPSTQQLYHAMLDRVRGTGRPLMIHFRCDAPARRRDMTLELTCNSADMSVDFVAHTMQERDRHAVALIDVNTPRDARMVQMCGWCKRVRLPTETWVEVEEAIHVLSIFGSPTVPRLSHGICERCEAGVLDALEKPSSEVA